MPVPLRTTYQKAEAKYNVTTDFPSLGLHSAAATGNVGLVEYALEHGQPINSVLDGVLPLHAACAGGNVQVVKLLMDHGADVNAPRLPRRYSNDKNRDASAPIVGTSGSAPLHFAAANGNTDVVSLLLLHGAHADRPDKHGVTPEMLAQQNGWLECAEVLHQWVLNKDRDLRERPGGAADDYRVFANGSRERLGSFGTEASEPSLSMRRRLQMKHSIDTALNRLRSPSLDPKQQSTSSTPPSSPFKAEYTFYPTSDEESLGPVSGGARRPSLPQVLYPPTSGPSNIRKTSTPSNESSSPRRPRSAGTGSERQDPDLNITSAARPTAARRLGSKYSLLNVFKRAQSGDSGQSVDTPQSRPSSSSAQATAHLLTNSPSAATSSPPLTTTHLSDNVSPSSTPSHYSRAGFRFHRGSDASSRAASQTQIPMSSHGKTTGAVPSPPQATVPLAADIHHTLTQQQSQERQHDSRSRNRSRSAGSGTRISPEEYPKSSPSSSPLTRLGLLRPRGHTRDRSGSGGSIPGSPGYRGGAVFDDDVMVENNDAERSEFRPSILMAHGRLPSNGQGFRALRFDSTSGSSGGGRNGNEGGLDPDGRGLLLRSSNSINSLSGYRRRMPGSPALRVSEEDLVLESASANGVRRESAADDDDDEEFEYGRPFPREKPLLDLMVLEASESQIGITSASSSDSSLSPIISMESATVEGSPSLMNADFPFSINRPPPAFPDDTEPAPSSPELLRVPSPTENRSRGDSVSSISTMDSNKPQLSISGTTSGSDTITTPLLTPTAVLPIRTSPKRNAEGLAMEKLHEEGLNIGGLNGARMNGVGVRPYERPYHIPPDISISSISSHAQAEALVQKAQQDILEMALDSGSLPPTGNAGRSPLSARLAAYGESLALERKLREQKDAEEECNSSTDKQRLEAPSSRTDNFMRDGRTTPTVDVPTRRDGVERQHSLEHKSGRPTPKFKLKDPRRPSTAEGLSPPYNNNLNSSDHTGRFYNSSRAVSGFARLPSSALSIEQDFDSVENHDNSVLRSQSNKSVYVHHDQNISSGYNRSGPATQPRSRSRTPHPVPEPENGQLSRISSLEAPDTDPELGVPIHRVSTAPLFVSPSRGKREVKTANKLTRMGFSPAEQAGRGTLPVSGSKRFGALKSFMQTIKGK